MAVRGSSLFNGTVPACSQNKSVRAVAETYINSMHLISGFSLCLLDNYDEHCRKTVLVLHVGAAFGVTNLEQKMSDAAKRHAR